MSQWLLQLSHAFLRASSRNKHTLESPKMSTTLEDRYNEERDKRQRSSKGLAGFIAAEEAGLVDLFTIDPWVQGGVPINQPVPDRGHCKIIIFGGGLGGMIFAVEALKTGAARDPSDIIIVEPAGGFGGVWWYNRYPGLMCDAESYQYFPYLEETGYMPTKRYSNHEEIRSYLDQVARHFKLQERTMFQTSGTSAVWENDHWVCEIEQKPKGGAKRTMRVTSDFVFICSGNMTYPKVPKVADFQSFKGEHIHTARWRYDITGGTPADPVMENLRNKRVAVVGTSATGIQVIPELAKYAGKLYVIQRTPAAVAPRLNKDTDPVEWKGKIAGAPGWQKARWENSQAFMELHDEIPEKIVVDDGWTEFKPAAGILGSPAYDPNDTSNAFQEKLRRADEEWSGMVRKRVLNTVKDVRTAEKLQGWFPGYCKSPCFHDEYLPAFNQPNVELVDTDGQGIEALTETGFVVNGQNYDADIIVWATGYGNLAMNSPAGKAKMTVIGRDPEPMEDLFKKAELTTLHGIMPRGFPNMFYPSMSQSGASICNTLRLSEQGIHAGYVIVEAQRRVRPGQRPVIEASEEGAQFWMSEIAANADRSGNKARCTPGFLNMEGDLAKVPLERRAKAVKFAPWGKGYLSYASVLHKWRDQGDLVGVDVHGADDTEQGVRTGVGTCAESRTMTEDNAIEEKVGTERIDEVIEA